MRIFFASDLHGSDRCFRKFLNAAAFYKADWLVMGGDAAGKQLVPLVQEKSTWTGQFQGARLKANTAHELDELERQLSDHGGYPLRTEADFVEQLKSDQGLVESTLHDLIFERAEAWVELARERVGTGVRCIIGLGNDDYDDLAAVFDAGPTQCPPDGLIQVDDFWLGTVGWSNVTPWRTHREKPEPDLTTMVDALAATPDPTRTIWNVHVPPFGSTLDTAPRLDDDLRVQLVGGSPDFIPVGSTAVADGITVHQPLLSLHGHIHESRGIVKVGGTTVVNPGSEYDQGTLLGALITVRPGKVEQCQLVVA
jgi:Icc-related predicted phosphoesterase